MAKGSKDHEGGLVAQGARNAGTNDGYWEFFAYEKEITGRIGLISVLGRVRVGNPGMKAVLSYAEPQGINPSILLLFLDVVQTPGIWPQRLGWAQCAYSQVTSGNDQYSQVQITDGEISITIPIHSS